MDSPNKTSGLTLTAASDGKQYPLVRETLVGREVECAIALDSAHISRYHAKIFLTQSHVVLEDLNSANGTYVNGKRIKTKTPISIGDEIRFDKLRFRLTSEQSGDSDATVVSATLNLSAIDNAKNSLNARGTHTPPPHTTQSGNQRAPQSHANRAAHRQNDLSNAPSPANGRPAEDEEHTEMLSSEQIDQFASINKHFQKFVDTGSGPRLIATTAPVRGKVFQFEDRSQQESWTIGRSRDSDICVADPSVSRLHGHIYRKNGRFFIKKADSKKALLINGNNTGSSMLRQNDMLQIGHLEFVFRLDERRSIDNARDTGSEEAAANKNRRLAFAAITALLLLLMGAIYWLA